MRVNKSGAQTVTVIFDTVASKRKYLQQAEKKACSIMETARKAKYTQNVQEECPVDADFLKWIRNREVPSPVQNIGQVSTVDTVPSKVSSKPIRINKKYYEDDVVKIKMPIKQIQDTDIIITDWGNTGWKLHLPVKPDVNDPLTNDICNFLNEKWGLDISKRLDRGGNTIKAPTFFQYASDGLARYKVGRCNDTNIGKGMTIYGTSGTKDEIFQLADEIESLFGARIATSGYPIFHKEMHIKPHVSARFVDRAEVIGQQKRYDYCEHVLKDAQGITTGKNYGTCVSSLDNLDKSHWPKHVIGNKQLENEFMAGDSVLETIRDYGEMFTGKIKDGKMPDFILESFSPEYLKYHPNLEQELPDVVKQGNLRYIKAMLRNIVSERPRAMSKNGVPILDGQKGKIDYLTQMDKKLIEEAKQEFARENPNFLAEFKQNIEAELSEYPELAVLL